MNSKLLSNKTIQLLKRYHGKCKAAIVFSSRVIEPSHLCTHQGGLEMLVLSHIATPMSALFSKLGLSARVNQILFILFAVFINGSMLNNIIPFPMLISLEAQVYGG